MLFSNEVACQMFHSEMVVLEGLAQDAVNKGFSVEGIGELFETISADYMTCRGKDCKVCDGVPCETAFFDTRFCADLYPCALALWKEWRKLICDL